MHVEQTELVPSEEEQLPKSRYDWDTIYVGSLNSLGRDLPHTLHKTMHEIGFNIDIYEIPMFQINEIVGQSADRPIWAHPQAAIGNLRLMSDLPALCVSWETLVNHARQLEANLTAPAETAYKRRRLEQYCLLVSMVHLVLQVILGISDEDRQIILDDFIESVIAK